MKLKKKKGNKGGALEDEREKLINDFEEKKKSMDNSLKVKEGEITDQLKIDLSKRKTIKADNLKKKLEKANNPEFIKKKEIDAIKAKTLTSIKEKSENLKGKADSLISSISGKFGNTIGKLKEKAGNVKDIGNTYVNDLKEKADSVKNEFSDSVKEIGNTIKKNLKEKAGNLDKIIDDFNSTDSILDSDTADAIKDTKTAKATTSTTDIATNDVTASITNATAATAATVSAAVFGNSNNNNIATASMEKVSEAFNETIDSNKLWENIKYNKYPLLILIILVINSYFIITNIIKYSNNNSLYNSSLTLRLNLYENKYNNYEFYNLPIILSLYVISLVLLILYYRYNEKGGGVFDLDYNSNCVISMIYFALIIVNIVIISIYTYNWMYDEIYNKINESLKIIDNKIYTEISPKFLYFMHKLETFGDNINSAKDLINKFINDYKDELKKNTDNIEDIIKDRLKLLITYKINKFYINSSNRDNFSNIENLIKDEKTNLFTYLKSDKYNILEPLEVEDIDIDEILKPFTSGANTAYNIEDKGGTIKYEIRKRYDELQRSTNKNISYIKNNSGNIYSRIFIYLSIFTIFCYFMLIISYIYILVYKIFNGKLISTKDLIIYHYVNYGYSIYILIILYLLTFKMPIFI